MDELKPPPMSDAEIDDHEWLLKADRVYASYTGQESLTVRGHREFVAAIVAARDQQWLALVGELQRDAERYRWLKRNADVVFHKEQLFFVTPTTWIYSRQPSIQELDAAIDTARGEKGGV